MDYQTNEVSSKLVGGLASPPSALQGALNEQGDQLDKLRGLLDQLVGRLQPVSNPRPTADDPGLNEQALTSSQLTGQVKMQTVSVKSMQALVGRVLDELEV